MCENSFLIIKLNVGWIIIFWFYLYIAKWYSKWKIRFLEYLWNSIKITIEKYWRSILIQFYSLKFITWII